MPESDPLIPNTTINKWLAGGISTVLTIGAGWAATELFEIGQATTRMLEDVELAQIRQEETSTRLNRVSDRVDRLYQIELDRDRTNKQ